MKVAKGRCVFIGIIAAVFVFGVHSPVAEAGAVEDGAELFRVNCSVCHGKAGNLSKDFTSIDVQKSLTEERIAMSIRNGRGQMPGFKDTFSDEEIKALILRIRKFGGTR